MNVARSLSVVNSKSAKYITRMKTSVATTFAMIAPTKNPSSRLKMTPHESQPCFKLKGLCTIEERPQTGHFSFRLRPKVIMIVRGSRFIRIWIAPPSYRTPSPSTSLSDDTIGASYFAVFFAALRLCVSAPPSSVISRKDAKAQRSAKTK